MTVSAKIKTVAKSRLHCTYKLDQKMHFEGTVKLGDKNWFDTAQIGVKEPFSATNLRIYFLRIRNIWL